MKTSVSPRKDYLVFLVQSYIVTTTIIFIVALKCRLLTPNASELHIHKEIQSLSTNHLFHSHLNASK